MYFDQMREKSEDLNRFKNRKKKKKNTRKENVIWNLSWKLDKVMVAS